MIDAAVGVLANIPLLEIGKSIWIIWKSFKRLLIKKVIIVANCRKIFWILTVFGGFCFDQYAPQCYNDSSNPGRTCQTIDFAHQRVFALQPQLTRECFPVTRNGDTDNSPPIIGPQQFVSLNSSLHLKDYGLGSDSAGLFLFSKRLFAPNTPISRKFRFPQSPISLKNVLNQTLILPFPKSPYSPKLPISVSPKIEEAYF
uniref:Uncharacterized protein n=1 Tax=Romanomermis culicivorax TaxID=13658 RepID=A0A915HIF7_ROMCU